MKDLGQKVGLTGPISFWLMSLSKYQLILSRGGVVGNLSNILKRIGEELKIQSIEIYDEKGNFGTVYDGCECNFITR